MVINLVAAGHFSEIASELPKREEGDSTSPALANHVSFVGISSEDGVAIVAGRENEVEGTNLANSCPCVGSPSAKRVVVVLEEENVMISVMREKERERERL